jgi:hypothetical protein
MILALDLERTLIATQGEPLPRPGLKAFLERAGAAFDRVVLFSTVPADRCREVARELVAGGHAPAWFADVGVVRWDLGEHKSLRFIDGLEFMKDALLVDDNPDYIAPGQESQFVEIKPFRDPYPADDAELERVWGAIAGRLS